MEFYSKDINIMRQSQQKMAFDFCVKRGYTPTFKELQRVTDVFVEVCLRPRDKELDVRIDKLDKWLDGEVQKKMDKIDIDGILID